MKRIIISVFVTIIIVSAIGCTREKPFSDAPITSVSQAVASTPTAVATAPSADTATSPASGSSTTGEATLVLPLPTQAGSDTPNDTPVPATATPAASNQNPAPQGRSTSYTVQPGDWLSKVARQFNVSNEAIIGANPGIVPNLLVPGQSLVIPGSSGAVPSYPQINPIPPPSIAPIPVPRGPFVRLPVPHVPFVPYTSPPAARKYTVLPGEWFYAIARKFGVSVDALEAANPAVNPGTIYPGLVLNIPAVAGGSPPPPIGPGPRPTNPGSTPVPVPTQVGAKTSTPIPTSAGGVVRADTFGYGTQVNWTNVDNDQEMAWVTGMGFNWAKAQVRWCDFEQSPGSINYGQIDQIINAATAKNIHVMLSVVCAPNWSRADGGAGGSGPPDDLQKAADFMANLSSRYCGKSLGAIEVWNEQNLITEWHGKAISAATYIDLLHRSYTAIKSHCSSMLVISGAPTPTGVTNSTAIDDLAYLQQMYANGLKQYSDAVGAHPSGFCNSPDAVEGASNPCGGQFNNHRSFFFKRTIESYRSVIVQNGDSAKRIWVTEFGWGSDPSPKAGYEYTKFITEATQASWEVKAYQNMKAYGYIGIAFLWNLDFTDMNSETGAFHVLNRPAYISLAGMAK